MIKTPDVTRCTAHLVRLTVGALLAFGLPAAASAQALLNPYAQIQVEHDSNVFRIENSTIAQQFYGGPTLADTDFRYIAGLDGSYKWSLQKFTANLEGREIRYDHFTFLNHSEYLGNIQWDWKVSDVLDGLLQARQERVAAYFADSNSPFLELNTDRNLVAKANLIIRTDYRLETGVNSRTYDAPLQNYPNFADRETGAHLGVSYLGIANLTYGIAFDRIDGRFEHATGVGPYTQSTGSLQWNYSISGLQKLSGALGYTKRDQTGEQNLSAFTGQLKYTRQLTGKTSVSAQFVRAVNSYIASAGSEIDTIGTVSAQWQATYKIALNASYSYQDTTYIGQAIASDVPGATNVGRTDHLPTESLNIIYLPLRNIQIKGYFTAQTRRSNQAFDRYHDTLAGVQLTAHWH